MSIYRRFFVSPSSIVGNCVDLSAEYQHIAKVLRMRAGDNIIVCCGDKYEHMCSIDSISSDAVSATIISSEISQSENKFFSTLYMGVLKGDKTDMVVQKAVELGVNSIVLFDSKYSVGGVSSNKLVRYNRIALEACKQCGRAVSVTVDYAGDIRDLAVGASSLVCYERENDYSLSNWAKDNSYPDKLDIVIGSEGGFDSTEIEMLSSKGCQIVTLGKRILRAETAPLYVLSALDTIYGGMQ